MVSDAAKRIGLGTLAKRRGSCSGFARGRPWAFQGGTPREEVDDEDPGMVILKLTPGLSTTLYPTMAAVELAQAFLRLDESRAEAVRLPRRELRRQGAVGTSRRVHGG